MGRTASAEAEDLAERCLEACNIAMTTGDVEPLTRLLTPDAVIEVAELTTEYLTGPAELAERLAESAHRQGLVLIDVHADGDDVVAGVAWEDDAWTRAAEVRLVTDGQHISRLEWVR